MQAWFKLKQSMLPQLNNNVYFELLMFNLKYCKIYMQLCKYTFK